MARKGKDMVGSYQRYLKLERNFTGNTVEAYMRDVDKLLRYLEGEGLTATEAKLENLQQFAASLHDLGIGARSQCRILSGVRTFYRFLILDGWIENDPSELLESPQIGDHLPEVLSAKEVDMLEGAIDLSKWEGHRNRAIIEVLFSCGLRVSELTHLTLSNLYLEDEFLRVEGKGRKERLVPISQRAIRELGFWFQDRDQMDNVKPGEEDYVFLNRRGAHLTRTMILIMIKRLAEDAGIQKTISPHTLRHSFATALLEGGAHTLRQEILNHHPRNISYKPDEQSDACIDSAMAGKGRMESNRIESNMKDNKP